MNGSEERAYFHAQGLREFDAEVASYYATDQRDAQKEELSRLLDIIHVLSVQLDQVWDAGLMREAEALLKSRQAEIVKANYLLGRIINGR